MAEVDYQMALLLQYRLDQEHKRKEATDSDYQLALELQEQFKTEVEIERPSNNLVYKVPKTSSGKSLVDPSWEVIDPTPDIHVLFMAFNKRFFWDTLGSVTVSWSKRMTTCAGICSYQGRGGMCSITLSEPLLKLRPRKDLVETLLHEMIHAYLFVTNNNRDRDGHGPEFHKHMYRINKEAGTNITVYHDFHDEVRLYQQHWWRCNGPCQNQKPYFGMIRRATNRAPGPYDRWWADHSRNCGGSFIKVRSPEVPAKTDKKAPSKKKEENPKDPKNDIRNYISTTSTKATPNNSNKENQSANSVSNINPKLTSTKSLPSIIHSVSNNTSSAANIRNVIPSKTGGNNIFGFTNLNNGVSSKGAIKKTGAVKNAGSSTFVVTKKTGSESTLPNKENTTGCSDIQPFSGPGRSLGSTSSMNSGDYSLVREHWLKKYENSSASTSGVKRRNSTTGTSSQKVPRVSFIEPPPGKVECPICKIQITADKLNNHLDTCLESPKKNPKECIICGIEVPSLNYENHVSECADKNFGKDDVFEDAEEKSCGVCHKNVSSKDYDLHVEKCIFSLCDDMDEKYELENLPKTRCLACNREITKSQLDAHLEECMSMTNVFDTTNVPIEEGDENTTCDNCPFCLKLIATSEMKKHLDMCLNSEDKKCDLMESFCDIDYDED